MEVHGENLFKIRSYIGAYNTLRRYGDPIKDLSRERLLEIKGIGKNIADKIEELLSTGSLHTLQKYIDNTPAGIVEMLDIKGLGAKKILLVWKELGVETPGELLYACEENRLIELKGFGLKTQENLKDQLVYYLDGKGKYLYGHIITEAEELLTLLQEHFPGEKFCFIDSLGRKMPVVDGIEILTTGDVSHQYSVIQASDHAIEIDGTLFYKGSKVNITHADTSRFMAEKWSALAAPGFLQAWDNLSYAIPSERDDERFFQDQGLAYIPPESRESPLMIQRAQTGSLELIVPDDIKGVIHAHSTYSDGAHSLLAMAEECQKSGYEYLVISDHSQSAFYADGLKPDRVYDQWKEIDELNERNGDFHIFKGIESDILSDGSLDYPDEMLSRFDLVIASVHSNLKMTQERAHQRLLAAIMNPATRILGHLTGRLLLSRPGYPIDHKLIIDACAQYNVAIELNASPYRLDMDWSWIPLAMERGVLISINPDAHSMTGIQDIVYGITAARKAGLRPSQCLNTMGRSAFLQWLQIK